MLSVILAVMTWFTNSPPPVVELSAIGRVVVDLADGVTNTVRPLATQQVFVRSVADGDEDPVLAVALGGTKEMVVSVTNHVRITLALPESVLNRASFTNEIAGPAIIKTTEIGPDLYYMEVIK